MEERGGNARVQRHSGQLPPTHGANPRRYDAGAGPDGDRAAPGRPSPRRGRHDRAALGPLPRAGELLRMRYPTVLFDLDGTLVASGPLLLASFKDAAKAVLERDVEEEQIAALVGGSSLHDQMAVLDPTRVDELVRVYREHNRPLHDELQAFEGVEKLMETLSAQGRKLGVVAAKGGRR